MDLKTFLNLPTEDVARLVREAGPKVCVFPINGTRRWFMLEYPPDANADFASDYLDIITKRHVEIYQLFFDHGIDTLLTPIFGPDLLERGDDYLKLAAEGMSYLTEHPFFLNFYERYGVRIHFYGDHRKYLGATPWHYLSELFDQVTEKTSSYQRCRLFFGVFAHDATETMVALSIDYYRKHHKAPGKRELVTMYYGEYVEPVSFFIGFDKFSAFDMPLVATGAEDLYFTVAPSPYINRRQLRRILYDHLYTRPEEETGYTDLTAEDWAVMHDFYHVNSDHTLGIGARPKEGGCWYPLPQVQLPGGLGIAPGMDIKCNEVE